MLMKQIVQFRNYFPVYVRKHVTTAFCRIVSFKNALVKCLSKHGVQGRIVFCYLV